VEEQAFMARNCAGNDRAIPLQLEKDEAVTIKATSITVPANIWPCCLIRESVGVDPASSGESQIEQINEVSSK
jgi:hypothetical protein